MKYADPYTPGAGFMPGHIAGRKETLERAEKYLNTIVLGYPQQSVIYYGLRGVGKTVLLNAIEKMFIFAMAKCEKLPCSILNVAKIMETEVSSISPYRAQLINKSMIYATGYAQIDFTVPGFDQFLKRLNPELQLDEVEKVQKGDAGDE